ncbi:hypothetical protein, partial [Leptospira ilyithenensis]|uniref:hypothetical protein n=1 Tax=Leptospira ilyithenensis TaxID=2484901 RepID=UPI0014385760
GANPTSGSYITFFSVSLTCNDAGGAGCDKIAYSTQTGSAPTDPATRPEIPPLFPVKITLLTLQLPLLPKFPH